MWGVTCPCRQEPLTETVLERYCFFPPAWGLQLPWLTCKTSRMRKGSLDMIYPAEYSSSYSALPTGKKLCLFPIQKYLPVHHLRRKQRSREELFHFKKHLLYWEQAAFHWEYREGINVPNAMMMQNCELYLSWGSVAWGERQLGARALLVSFTLDPQRMTWILPLAGISNHFSLVAAAENKFPNCYCLLLKTCREVSVASGEIGTWVPPIWP